MTSAKHDKIHYDAAFDCEARFYARSNFLTVIRLQGPIFWTGGTQYTDDTGVPQALYERLEREADAP